MRPEAFLACCVCLGGIYHSLLCFLVSLLQTFLMLIFEGCVSMFSQFSQAPSAVIKSAFLHGVGGRQKSPPRPCCCSRAALWYLDMCVLCIYTTSIPILTLFSVVVCCCVLGVYYRLCWLQQLSLTHREPRPLQLCHWQYCIPTFFARLTEFHMGKKGDTVHI